MDKTETTRKINLRADAFNVLNHTNCKTYVGTVTSSWVRERLIQQENSS